LITATQALFLEPGKTRVSQLQHSNLKLTQEYIGVRKWKSLGFFTHSQTVMEQTDRIEDMTIYLRLKFQAAFGLLFLLLAIKFLVCPTFVQSLWEMDFAGSDSLRK
jgi:hypothetical protein